MSQAQMMTPLERMGFKRQSVTANVTGSVNTAVVLYQGAVIASNPVTPRAVTEFCTITDSATLGSTFKFTRKGLYQFVVQVPMTAGEVAAAAFSIGLDVPAAQWLAAGHTPANLALYEDFFRSTQLAAMQVTPHLVAEIYINDFLAGTTLNANGTPVGTVRVLASSGAGVLINNVVTIDAEVGLVCWLKNETFG